VGKNKQAILSEIDSLYATGGTALYDSISSGFDYFQANPESKKITALVVLSDGEDTESKLALNPLISKIRSNNETKNTRIFTIGYGRGADMKAPMTLRKSS